MRRLQEPHEEGALKLSDRLNGAIQTVQRCWSSPPVLGIVLGTGLGEFAEQIDVEAVVSYEDIPGFPRSTAIGHRGQLVCGTLTGVPTIALQGRFHLYEGHSWQDVTLPVHLFHRLGIEALVLSNAAGGVNPKFGLGEVMVIDSHIDLLKKRETITVDNDVATSRVAAASQDVGSNGVDVESKFSCLATQRTGIVKRSPYHATLIDHALETARRQDFVAHQGTYVALTGPNYETRSEYRMVRHVGGDVVGMSTVPEAQTAAMLSLPVLAMSVVTNVATPDQLLQTDGHEVIDAAACAQPKLASIVKDFAGRVADTGSVTKLLEEGQ